MAALSSLGTFSKPQIPPLPSPSDFRSFNSINTLSFSSRTNIGNNSRHFTAVSAAPPMASEEASVKAVSSVPDSSIKLLFVEMGVGYDQHGQDITSAAMRACRDAISSNSIPAFRRGSIPGVSFGEMKLQIKLGVPRPLQHLLDVEKVKSVFPYGAISNVEVVDGGLICSSGVHVEEMGDKNDDCYIVNAAVYVGY
ncbi:Unknown protein [Striga hermonthica]|uniref:50S ribosomal protein L34 n=1 Tax=Striga hermonthica TaxID=68872 RepID=A0A9N7N0Y3_STRHE|nr:Unknown protein [Striga hermonthica]